MKTNKEYPATHSNDTAWFCVDLDGNVAVFDIEENGPTPNDFEGQHCIADLMTECLPSHTEENIYDFPLWRFASLAKMVISILTCSITKKE